MIRTSHVLFWFGLSIASSLALYHTSGQTQALERQLRDLNAQIGNEQQTIHVLKAEWVFLSNPTRVENEAKKFLALRPTAPAQVITLASLDDALPTEAEAMHSVAVASTPIATVKTSLALPPVVVAKNSPPTAPAHALHAAASPPQKEAHKIAAANKTDAGHINDRMVIQRTASAQPADTIGALLDGLGSRP